MKFLKGIRPIQLSLQNRRQRTVEENKKYVPHRKRGKIFVIHLILFGNKQRFVLEKTSVGRASNGPIFRSLLSRLSVKRMIDKTQTG